MSRFSELALPPIRPEEAEKADYALCPYHNGEARAPWAHEGRVFYCPIGRQFWRFTEKRSAFNARIHYPPYGVL